MNKSDCSCLCASPPKKTLQQCEVVRPCVQNLEEPVKYNRDLENLNVTKQLKRIGSLFRYACFRYRVGSPAITYKVAYTILSPDKLQVPTGTKACRPFSSDETQVKFSFTPLVEYVKAYKLLSVTRDDSVAYQEIFNNYLQKYYAVVDFLVGFPVHITPKYLYCVELYGGLERPDYIKLATLLIEIRKILLTNDASVKNLITKYNEIQTTGVVIVKNSLDCVINKNSIVYNKHSVPQDKLYIK